MPVIDEGGVVGQIVRVTPYTSEAALLIDDQVSIPVQVLRNGLRLIAFGSGEVGRLEVRYLTANVDVRPGDIRSEEHTSELQSLMRISYAVFCLKKKKKTQVHKRIKKQHHQQ